MVNKATELRRGFMLASISLAAVAVVVVLGVAVNAHAKAASRPASPASGESWNPANGATFFVSHTSQIVAYMTPAIPEAFTITAASLNTIEPGQPPTITNYPADSAVLPGSGMAVVTATEFAFGTPGEQVQFVLTYTTASNPSPTVATVTYLLVKQYQTFIPAVYVNYPIIPVDGVAGNDPCSAGITQPDTDYTTTQDAPYKFYSLSVPVTSNLVLTVTGYPFGGQMQLRTPPPAPSCATTGTQYVQAYTDISTSPILTALVVGPGPYLARFTPDTNVTSTVPFTFRWSLLPAPNEPNNTPCTATPIKPNTLVSDYPDDTEDWFSFGITSTSTVMVAISNYAATDGQLQLKQQNTTCDNASLQLLDYAGISSGSAVLAARTLTPTRYYVRVVTVSGLTPVGPYRLSVSLSPGAMSLGTDSQSGTTQSQTSPPIPFPAVLPKVFRLPPQP